MSLPGPSVEEVEEVLCCPTEEDETYVWKLLEAQNNAFLAEFNAVDQQIAKAKWVVVHPIIKHPHLLTVILLHERSDFPQSLAKRFFGTRIGWDLLQHSLGIKWVFPKAPASLYRFGRPPMWFDTRESPAYKYDMEYSACYLNYIIEREAALLGWGTQRILLCGVEQGAAIAIYSLLKQPTPLRSVVGVGGWLDPDLVPDNNLFRPSWSRGSETPVFLLHDRLDTVVTVKEAHQMLAALEQRGMNVAYIEAAANRLYSVRNMPPFKLGALEIQIIRTLSGLQRIKVPATQNDVRKGGLAHGQVMRSRYRHRRRPSRLGAEYAAPLGELPVPGVIDYSLGRVPVSMAGLASAGRFNRQPPQNVEDFERALQDPILPPPVQDARQSRASKACESVKRGLGLSGRGRERRR